MSSASKGKSKFKSMRTAVDNSTADGSGRKCNVTDEVGEIFTAAGTAFTKLGELTMQLHSSSVGGSTNWTEEDIAMMHNCLTKFANEIDEISNRVRLRTMTHINSSIKKREYEDVGLSSPHHLNSLSSSSSSSTTNSDSTPRGNKRTGGGKRSSTSHSHLMSITPPHTQEVTLNMLNASSEEDGDTDLKMDFDSPGPS